MKKYFVILILFLVTISCKVTIPTNEIHFHSTASKTTQYLILTADDYGVSENVNEGIEYAANLKLITAIEAMTNFAHSLPDLKNIQINHPEISIGVHLNITSGKPILPVEQVPTLVDENGNFNDLEGLLPVAHLVDLSELKLELEAQIQAAIDANIEFDHFSNQHNILSLYSPFFDIIIDLAHKHKVALRTTVIGSAKYPDLYPDPQTKVRGKEVAKSFIKSAPIKAISFLKYGKIDEMEENELKMDSLNIPHADVLIDYFYGKPTPANLLYILNHLPAEVNEIAFHLGTDCREESYCTGLNLDYFINRELELATLTSQYIQDKLKESDIKIINYKSLIQKQQ